MLEISMAVAISPRLASPDAPPAWLIFVAPPSLGKTATVELLRDTQGQGLTKFVTTPSRAALATGYKDPKTGKAASSLLRELDGLCWVDPEFNAVLSGDPRKVGELFGALTAAFDGTYTPAFGNQIGSSSVVAIRCRFSFLACATPRTLAKHHGHMMQLGPRCLYYRVPPLTDVEEQRGLALALGDGQSRSQRLAELRALVSAHLAWATTSAPAVSIPERDQRIIEALARMVSAGRTEMMTESEEDEAGRPVTTRVPGDSEGPFRVAQQLKSLLVALTTLHGAEEPTPRALRLVRDVALSSLEPARAETIQLQRVAPVVAVSLQSDGEFTLDEQGHPEILFGLTATHLAQWTGWSERHARRVLSDLVTLGLYERVSDGVKIIDTLASGRQPEFYRPTEGLAWLLNNPFEPDCWEPLTLGTVFKDSLPQVSPLDLRFLEGVRTNMEQLAGMVAERAYRDEARTEEDVVRALQEVLHSLP